MNEQLYWKNKKVEDLTHEELLVAMYQMQNMLENERRWRKEEVEMEQLFHNATKRLYKGI